MKLTKSAIDALSYVSDGSRYRQCIYWDDDLKGFGVRVQASGKKAFVISYRFNGTKHIMQIGQYGTLTPYEARTLARQRLADVVRGANPMQEKITARTGETMADLCRRYVSEYAVRKKSGIDDKRLIERRILPAFGKRRLKDITHEDICRFHKRYGAPIQANRCLSLLSKLFNLAKKWGYLPRNADNPAQGVDRNPEKRRLRYVTRHEMPRLLRAIETEPNIYNRAAIWLYILTGVRKSELLRLKWSDVNMHEAYLDFVDTKNTKTLRLPLTDGVKDILQHLPKLPGNDYVLCGSAIGRPIVNIDKAWRRIRAEAGLEDVWLHDLRRTVGSWLVQSGSSLPLIGRVLNHSKPDTTAIYAVFNQEPVRAALESHSRAVMDSLH